MKRHHALGFATVVALCLAVLAHVHFTEIRRAAVDIPFWDEWEQFNSPSPNPLTFDTLIKPHNEHRIVPIRLARMVLGALDQMDFRLLILGNFYVFLGIIVAWSWLGARSLPLGSLGMGLAALAFLLSPRLAENHAWAFQSLFHFVILCHVVGCALLFSPTQRRWHLGAGAISLAFATVCLASGLVTTLVASIIFLAFKLTRAWDAKRRRNELTEMLAVVLPLAAAAHGLITMQRLPFHPAWAMPWTDAFWGHFLTLVANGFGIDDPNLGYAALWLALATIPIAWLALRSRLTDAVAMGLVAISAGILAAMASISLGRAGFGIEQAKASRYVEVGIMLIPAMVYGWLLVTRNAPRWRLAVWVLLMGGLAFAFQNDWGFRDVYNPLRAQRLAGRECVAAHILRGEPDLCPQIYPGRLTAKLLNARRANVKFYRDLLKREGTP